MIVHVDLSVLPARTSLDETDDFNSLKVQVTGESGHVFIARETFLRLAGESGVADPAWVEKLDAMLGAADGAGWVDEHGAVRAHVER